MSTFTGTTGADSIVGTSGDDVINAIAPPGGSDSLYGGDGADAISGSVALGEAQINPLVYGGTGNDTINFDFTSSGGYKSAVISGDAGNDQIVVTADFPLFGETTIDGGDGVDSLVYSLGSSTVLPQNVQLENFEHVTFTNAPSDSVVLSADQVRGVSGAINFTETASPVTLSVYVEYGSGPVDFTQAGQPLNILTAGDVGAVTGSAFGDEIRGTNGEALYGGAGDDTIFAASGFVSGGAGNDLIDASIGTWPGVADGGDGNDTLSLTANVDAASIAVDAILSGTPVTALQGEVIRNFEQLSKLTIVGENDTITAGSQSTQIDVSGDHDVVYASANTSAVYMSGTYNSGHVAHIVPAGLYQTVILQDGGGVGADGYVDLDYSSASSAVHFGTDVGTGAYEGGPNVQTNIYVGDSAATATSSATITSSSIRVVGGVHDDVLAGTPAYYGPSEQLYGGDGNDTLIGSPNTDILDGGAGLNTLSFDLNLFGYMTPQAPPAGVTVDLTIAGAQSTGVGTSTITGFESVVGSGGADTLLGDDSANALSGITGSDALQGRGGDDTLTGGPGSDTLDGGGGVDTATYAGFVHDYALGLNGGDGTVGGGPEGGTDRLTSIEDVGFLDGTLTFELESTAAQVVRLYDSFLGRAPDVAGFDSYLNYVASGHSFQDMADNAASSPEFAQATAGLNDTQYVTYVYEHSLHREPDAGGLQTYVTDLQNGTLTRTSLIVQAAESPEHVALTSGVVAQGLWIPDAKVESLELLYDASVQRQPDAYGLAGYSAEIAQGTTYKAIANQMASSAEFQAAHAGQDDAAYIDSLYVAEVGRHADDFGLHAYEAQIANGYSRGDILYETAFSQEHQSYVLAFYDPILG